MLLSLNDGQWSLLYDVAQRGPRKSAYVSCTVTCYRSLYFEIKRQLLSAEDIIIRIYLSTRASTARFFMQCLWRYVARISRIIFARRTGVSVTFISATNIRLPVLVWRPGAFSTGATLSRRAGSTSSFFGIP